MTENNDTTTGRKDTGLAGPSRTVSQADETSAGAGGNGNKAPAPRLVERKTELRGLGIGARREPKNTVRRRTERDLSTSDPEVPCIKTEKAVRDLVCSLMERQDRMNEAIFLQLNDLGYRLDDMEEDIRGIQKGGGPE